MTLAAEVHHARYFCQEYKKAADNLVRLHATMDRYKYQHKHSLQQITRVDSYWQLHCTIKSTLILANRHAGGLTAMEILDRKRFVCQARLTNDR
jgi:hypothetical protein